MDLKGRSLEGSSQVPIPNLPRLVLPPMEKNNVGMFSMKSNKVLSPAGQAPVYSVGGLNGGMPFLQGLKLPPCVDPETISVSSKVKVMTPVDVQEKFSMPESHNNDANSNSYLQSVAIGIYKPQLPTSVEDSGSCVPLEPSQILDDDPNTLLNDIDEVLKKEETFETCIDAIDSPVAQTEVLDAGEFLAIRERNTKDVDKEAFCSPEVPREESCPELGINVRNGLAPQENLADYNIQLRTESTQEKTISLLDLLRHLQFLKQQVKRKREQHYIPGRVVFGTEKACQGLLDAEMLPSHTQGVIITESLRPSLTGQFRDTVEFNKQEIIGVGSYGTVHLCIDKTTKKEFVLKMISKDLKKSEVEILLKLENKNITRLFGVITRDGQPEILMENCGQSLLQFAVHQDTQGLMTQERIFDFNRQGLQGLQYLAIHKIIHFDIKPENICIQENNNLKITDFGSACSPQDQITFEGWTAEYMSPEACRMFLSSRFPIAQLPPVEGDNSVTTQTDLFAWAMTLLFMYRKVHVQIPLMTNGQTTYKNVDQAEIGKLKLNIILSMARNPNMVKQLLIPDNCSPDMKKLIAQMLEGRPDLRITPSGALKEIEEMGVQAFKFSQDSLSPLPSDESFTSSASESSMAVKHCTKPVQQRRRLSSISSNGSSSSFLPSDAPPSPQSAVKCVEIKKAGAVRRRSVKRRLRERIACPYRTDNEIADISPSTPLDGNVPNFFMMK